jgi:hypothetical protein
MEGFNMLGETLTRLAELDKEMAGFLLREDTPVLINELKALLKAAAEQPGRASKLRCTYLLERMIEAAQDLVDEGAQTIDGQMFFQRFSDVVNWLDRGLVYAAKLANPDTAGKYVEAFDQAQVQVEVYNPKDEDQVKQREKAAEALQGRFADHLREMKQATAAKKGAEPHRGNIIIPGGLK